MKFSLQTERRPQPAPFKIPYTDKNARDSLAKNMGHLLSSVPSGLDLVCVCVGSDRSTGDALGPLVGSKLSHLTDPRVHVYGTLDDPVHAVNLSSTIRMIESMHPGRYVIAVDACLGQLTSVGNIQLGVGPIKPGAGVNKELPSVGDAHLTGVVNVGGFMEYFVLQNTRLSVVMHMADTIADAVQLSVENTLGLIRRRL